MKWHFGRRIVDPVQLFWKLLAICAGGVFIYASVHIWLTDPNQSRAIYRAMILAPFGLGVIGIIVYSMLCPSCKQIFTSLYDAESGKNICQICKHEWRDRPI